MAPVGVIMAICSETLLDSIMMVKDNLYLIPLCVFYAIALFFGLLGIKHLEASVVSPLENIDGAIAAIILYFFFMFTGSSRIIGGIGVMDIIATLSIVAGVVLLGIQEQTLSKQEAHLSEDKKRHRFGALALVFPIIYNLVDAVSMVAVAICMWLYMLIVKQYKYDLFKKKAVSEFDILGNRYCFARSFGNF